MDKNAKKKKKRSKSGDVKSYFKESVLVLKRNFHKLLSSSSAAVHPRATQNSNQIEDGPKDVRLQQGT